MKRLIPYILLGLMFSGVSAQNQVDALRYSQMYPGGTARSIAMGGAFGALGGDFISVSQNPAGLGFYRNGELTFSSELFCNKNTSRYFGNELTEYKYNFNISNFGFVSPFNSNNSGSSVKANYAFGYNRVNNFHENINIGGINYESSLGDSYAESANLGGPKNLDELDPYTEGLFYDAQVISFDSTNNNYFLNPDIYPNNQIHTDQSKQMERSGRISEWVFATGINVNDKVYFGATFAFSPIKYTENSYFEEYDANETNYRYFNFYENKEVKGMGYAGKFGVIIKPLNFLRLGLAFHTPTSYLLEEHTYADIRSQYVNGTVKPSDGYNVLEGNNYEYTLVTPYKTIGSLGLILGKFAVISADVEFIDYSSMRFKNGGDGYNFNQENKTINDIYQKTFNAKSGIELRLEKLYLRYGFGYYGSPYKSSEINSDANTLIYNAGIGYRTKEFFFDFAWSYQLHEEQSVLYTWGEKKYTTNLDTNISRFIATIGIRL